MLDNFRQSIRAALSQERMATISTYGAAGLQAGRFPCEADGMRLFLLVPATSDLLHNLEQQNVLVVTTASWQVHGRGRIAAPDELPAGMRLLKEPDSRWCVPIEVHLVRFERAQSQGWGFRERIDLE